MKTVLFLVNGWGVEHKNSYSIYDKELVPNFDKLMNKYLFERLKKTTNNYQEAYRNMSIDINEIYNYSIVRRAIEDGSLIKSEPFTAIKARLDEKKGKVHIFCLVDKSMKIIDDLKYALKNLVEKAEPGKTNDNIFLHCILVSSNYEDYPEIQEVLSKINVELGDYARIGMVMGLAALGNNVSQVDMNFNIKVLLSEVGERWQSFKQKFEVSQSLKQAPVLTKPFMVNTGFKLENEDSLFFWNYDSINLTSFLNTIKAVNYGENYPNNITFRSVFPMKYDTEIPHILEPQKADMSLARACQELGFKTLVLAKKAQVNAINYYLNGLENVSNPNINYIEFDNYLYKDDEIVNVINNYDHELIIINYDIDECKTVKELKETLSKIDGTLGKINENMMTNSYSIIVSSLYSNDTKLLDDNNEVVNVAYNGLLPVIFISGTITKKEYILNTDGTINDLFKMAYQVVNPKYNGKSILVKKNFLFKLFFN